MSDRERASDNRRNEGGPPDRASFMSSNDEVMTFNTIQQERERGYTVGPNAPEGGHPTTYTVGGRGQEDPTT
jgi:hypothetical protein